MTTLRSSAAIAGAAALLLSLVGCSTAMQASVVSGVKPVPTHTSAPAAAAQPIPAPSAASTPQTAAQSPTAPTPIAPTPTACAGTPAGIKHIYVSISQQHLWACTGDALLTDTVVTTGASALTNVHDATPIGTSRITGKVRNTVLAGRDVNGSWNDHVTYWMPFLGGDGFHDAPWQTFPLGSQLYKTQGSHGCVHVPLNVLTQLFDWAPVGTLVTVRS